MNSERRVEFINGVPFTHFEPVPESGGPVDWNGGCAQAPPTPPPVHWERDQSDPAWVTATIDDGASMFFGKLGER